MATTLLLLVFTSLAAAFPLEAPALHLGVTNFNEVTISNVGSILEMLIKSGGSVKNVIDKFSNVSDLAEVEKIVEESQEIIERLQQGVSAINEDHKTFAGEALKDMIYIRLQLKTSRLSLNDLAKRTVYAVGDLKAFSEAFFAGDTDEVSELANAVQPDNSEKLEYVKEQMTVMVHLVKDTNTKVDEVKKIYSDIKARMVGVEEKLVRYKLMVEHLLRNETSDGSNYQVNSRAGVYTSAGVSTTACIVADILGAMGICSLINAAVVTTSTITLEVALANMRANLETLRRDGEVAIADVQVLMATNDEVEEYLYGEEQALVYWVAALQLVERKTTNSSRLFLKAPPVVRDRYLVALDELGGAAQNYLDMHEL